MAACDFLVEVPSSLLCLESRWRKVSPLVVRSLKELCGSVPVVRNRGLQPRARRVSLPGRLIPLSHVTTSDRSAEARSCLATSVFGTYLFTCILGPENSAVGWESPIMSNYLGFQLMQLSSARTFLSENTQSSSRPGVSAMPAVLIVKCKPNQSVIIPM